MKIPFRESLEVKRQERGIKRVKETLRRLMRLLPTALSEGIRSTEEFCLQEHFAKAWILELFLGCPLRGSVNFLLYLFAVEAHNRVVSHRGCP